MVGTSLVGLDFELSLGDDDHPHLFTRAVWQHYRAAQRLVGLASVDSEIEGKLYRLVETASGKALQKTYRVLEVAGLALVVGLHRFAVFPASPCHSVLPSCDCLRLVLDDEPHTASRAGDHLDSGIDIVGV